MLRNNKVAKFEFFTTSTVGGVTTLSTQFTDTENNAHLMQTTSSSAYPNEGISLLATALSEVNACLSAGGQVNINDDVQNPGVLIGVELIYGIN
ncbi:hypothetical protein [Kluyvera intermedia]|uniref:hypothetical protein n=1 Tax=Kluyvera intermedia TaxID=61648 RepID=UPI003526C332